MFTFNSFSGHGVEKIFSPPGYVGTEPDKSDSIRGLPMRIWKGATAGAGCFANGQAAHYRRIAVLRVLKSCGPKVPAFPFLGFAYACISDSPSDIQVSQVKKLQKRFVTSCNSQRHLRHLHRDFLRFVTWC
ncbi:PREDICTED: uncharacterized protein LOC107352396 isoform X2 [Acropora digitifera]|uniref:uncharacterized protein LOC107352396 isoform X2 n=1 Tax=Acropora digitifera TaxID=70779 RepID=UPI00077A5F1E|nr:PREDICTED: uncharacterized protein LOC107352396 isoform X2 [Acropora digitifera]